MIWLEEQLLVFRLAETNTSFFISGPAGTGKSAVVHEMVNRERKKGRRVSVTSTSGTSAVELGGGATTFHRFMGLNIHEFKTKEKIEYLLGQEYKPESAAWRIKHTDMLVR